MHLVYQQEIEKGRWKDVMYRQLQFLAVTTAAGTTVSPFKKVGALCPERDSCAWQGSSPSVHPWNEHPLPAHRPRISSRHRSRTLKTCQFPSIYYNFSFHEFHGTLNLQDHQSHWKNKKTVSSGGSPSLGLASILCFNQVAVRKEALHQLRCKLRIVHLGLKEIDRWEIWRRISSDHVWPGLMYRGIPWNMLVAIKMWDKHRPRRLGYKKEELDFLLLNVKAPTQSQKPKTLAESIPKAFVLSWAQDCTLKPCCMDIHLRCVLGFQCQDAKAVEQAITCFAIAWWMKHVWAFWGYSKSEGYSTFARRGWGKKWVIICDNTMTSTNIIVK